MAIKAVIFDCFGVLVFMPGKNALKQTYPDIATQIDNLSFQSDYGIMSRTDYYQAMADLVGLMVEDLKSKYYYMNVRNDQMINWIHDLRKTGKYKIGMVSNIGRHWLDDFMVEAEQSRLFDEVILSGEVGMVKPDRLIFEMMADKLSVDVSECIMIDDMLMNVEGASRAGMQGILFGNNHQAQADFDNLVSQNA